MRQLSPNRWTNKIVGAVRTRSTTSLRVSLAGLLAFLLVAPGPTRAGQNGRPLTESDLLTLLAGGVYSDRVATLVRERGIAFSPTKRDLELLQHAGADKELQSAVLAAPESLHVTTKEPTDAKPVIRWHQVDGHWHWHCVANCAKYRHHPAEP